MPFERGFHFTEGRLQQLSETNLKGEFQKVHEFSENAIHFANRCDIEISLKQMALAEYEASNLRQQALQRFMYGAITGEEFINIVDTSSDLIHSLLPEEITKAMLASCDCRKA